MLEDVLGDDGGREDLLLDQAMELIANEEWSYCTRRLLARALGVSLAGAERLIENLVESGILGPNEGLEGYPVLSAEANDEGADWSEVDDEDTTLAADDSSPDEMAPADLAGSAAVTAAQLDLPAAANTAAPAADDEQQAEPTVPTATASSPQGAGGCDLKVDSELCGLIASLREEELAGLRESLREEGCRDPIVVWAGEGIILDGHNRYRICKDLALPYKIVEIPMPDRLAAKMWILNNQMNRRNLTDDQRAQIVAMRLKIMAERIKHERAAKGGKGRADTAIRDAAGRMGGTSLPDAVTGTLATDSVKQEGRARKDSRSLAAKDARVPERKIRQALDLLSRAPEVAEQVADGTLSLREGTKQLEGQESAKPKVSILGGGLASAKGQSTVPRGAVEALESSLARLTKVDILQFLQTAPQATERALRLAGTMHQTADDLEACVASVNESTEPIATVAPAKEEADHA